MHASSVAAAPIDPPRVRTTLGPRPPEPTSPPPPYEAYEAYPAFTTVSPGISTRTNSFPRPPDGLGDSSRSRARRPAQSLSIPHLREAIHTLESKMASLLNERDLLESRLEQAVRMQSPVQRLPDELLSSIFEIGVLDGDEEDPITLANLMIVCRQWRDVAVDTPALWSRIWMGTRHSFERARVKLERSKTVPLYIGVDFSPRVEYGSVSTESLMLAMDLLRPAIWRWRTFHLTVPNRPQAHAALTRCRERAPLLEVMAVRIGHSMQEDQFFRAPLPLFDSHTPRLRSCSFTSFNFNWDTALVTQLRVLKLGGYWNAQSPSVDVILRILRACPLLEELALRNMSDVEADSCSMADFDPPEQDSFGERLVHVADARPVQLPRLVEASFYYCGNVRTRTLLSLLSFPALERIELCFLDNVSPLLEHLRRQSLTRLPLRHVRIESSYFNEMKLVRLLKRLPALTSLEFVDADDVSSNLLKIFATPAATQTWVCPKLTSLWLEGCTSVDWEALRAVVESRLPAQSRALPPPKLSRGSSTSNSAQPPRTSSSASAFATQAQILSRVPAASSSSGYASLIGPRRLESLNLSRCHQISREMVQWLRMYVVDVRCEPTKGVWGEPLLA
ncbi:uncharacterized protein B0H18DRAFT_868060 [Fomitopsis serialis]|uniref:uncharacterized protein n=1 Tax=Fomitopsis serialis TaxID=139415 RepID=UPI002007F077|nr:uncharacterized protein B0H18DRAFT_868060 [Neoantrodia serialis]KAH9936154.1 hypothetical protein B0H18DRAFT_868060 [Neoantrodia serialis]